MALKHLAPPSPTSQEKHSLSDFSGPVSGGVWNITDTITYSNLSTERITFTPLPMRLINPSEAIEMKSGASKDNFWFINSIVVGNLVDGSDKITQTTKVSPECRPGHWAYCKCTFHMQLQRNLSNHPCNIFSGKPPGFKSKVGSGAAQWRCDVPLKQTVWIKVQCSRSFFFFFSPSQHKNNWGTRWGQVYEERGREGGRMHDTRPLFLIIFGILLFPLKIFVQCLYMEVRDQKGLMMRWPNLQGHKPGPDQLLNH